VKLCFKFEQNGEDIARNLNAWAAPGLLYYTENAP